MAPDGATATVALVPLDTVHLARSLAWANDPALRRLMDRGRPVTEPEHAAWFESIRSRSDCAYFAVEQADEPRHVGNIWFWAIDERHRKAELRVVIGEPSARGRGLGRQAIDLLCRYGFERLGLHRVYAYVLDINPAARRAFEKAGFSQEGILREDRRVGDQYADAYLLARLAPR